MRQTSRCDSAEDEPAPGETHRWWHLRPPGDRDRQSHDHGPLAWGALRDELEAYLEHVAEKFDLKKHIRFDTARTQHQQPESVGLGHPDELCTHEGKLCRVRGEA